MTSRTIALALAAATCGGEASPPTIAGQRELAKREWERVALRELRKESCSEGGVFRRCSDTNRDECENTIAAALRECIETNDARFPATITAGDEDEHLREQLMGCMWHHAAFALGPARVDMACLLTPRARGG